MDGHAELSLRRRPVQQRSVQRLARILDACAAVLDEVGYDALTTTLVAQRAGVPVGSVYQFFPDKRAAVAALTARYLAEFEEAVRAAFARRRPVDWAEAVDALVRTYREMHERTTGFGRVHFGDRVDLHLLDPVAPNDVVVARALVPIVAEATGLVPADLTLPVRVAVEAADGVLSAAFGGDSAGDVLLEEARLLLAGYLERRLGPLPG